MPNLVSLTRSSLQILGKTQTKVFPGAISLIQENCHSSRNSDDVDVKFGLITKLYNKNKTVCKKIDDDVMSENCEVIIIFRIFGQFGAIGKLNSGGMVC